MSRHEKDWMVRNFVSSQQYLKIWLALVSFNENADWKRQQRREKIIRITFTQMPTSPTLQVYTHWPYPTSPFISSTTAKHLNIIDPSNLYFSFDLYKGKWQNTKHPLEPYISLDHHNLFFHWIPLTLSTSSIARAYKKAP